MLQTCEWRRKRAWGGRWCSEPRNRPTAVIRFLDLPLAELGFPQQLTDEVPTCENLGRQTFLGLFTGRQVFEKRCGYGGSIKSISVERDPFRQKQLLEALLLIERRLHPQVRRTR